MKSLDEMSGDVVDVALRLHRDLGPGLLESVYEMILAARLEKMGYALQRQHPVNVEFEGLRFDAAFRIDLLIEGRFLVEIKSVERLTAIHGKQLLTYLRLTNQPVGLLINFGGETLKEGLRRIVNDYRPSASSRLRVNQRSSDVRPDRHDRAGDRRVRGYRFGDRRGAGGAGGAAGAVRFQCRQA